MLTGILIGAALMLVIVLAFGYWWTDGNIFSYI
jgi:nitrogen fixation-related uncharacterized protein